MIIFTRDIFVVFLCASFLSLISCNPNNEKGFIAIGENADLKIISFSTNSSFVEDGDLVEFKCFSWLNKKTTLIADSTMLNELFNDTITYREKEKGELMQLLNKLQEGDSCLVRFFKGAQLYGRIVSKVEHLNASDTIYAYLKLKHIYKGKEKLAYLLEENAIARFITFSQYQWQATENGIFYRIVKASTRNKLVFNDPIKLVYKGYFLNQQVFDNYAEINPYFEYNIGTQNQLIRGMEIAVKYMTYGSEAEFIFPSSLAFGTQGSSTGIVSAYKPLLYKVKILNKEVL